MPESNTARGEDSRVINLAWLEIAGALESTSTPWEEYRSWDPEFTGRLGEGFVFHDWVCTGICAAVNALNADGYLTIAQWWVMRDQLEQSLKTRQLIGCGYICWPCRKNSRYRAAVCRELAGGPKAEESLIVEG